jgi:hypothetical protein
MEIYEVIFFKTKEESQSGRPLGNYSILKGREIHRGGNKPSPTLRKTKIRQIKLIIVTRSLQNIIEQLSNYKLSLLSSPKLASLSATGFHSL